MVVLMQHVVIRLRCGVVRCGGAMGCNAVVVMRRDDVMWCDVSPSRLYLSGLECGMLLLLLPLLDPLSMLLMLPCL